MTAPWVQYSAPTAGTRAQVQQAIGIAGGQQPRLRSLTVGVIGNTSVPAGTVVGRDGAYSTGATLFALPLSAPTAGSATLALSQIDIRAPSGTISIEFLAASASSSQQFILANGDFVQSGDKAFADSN